MILGIASKLALRDLSRHRRRTVLVGLTVTAGAAVIVVNGGFVTGIERQLVDHLLIEQTGHLQIRAATEGTAARGSDFGSAELIRAPEPIRAAVLRRFPGSRASLKLSSLAVMQGEGTSSSRVALRGIEPDQDRRLLSGLRELAEGPADDLVSGTVYLGAKLAAVLRSTAGSTVTVSVPTADGGLDAADFRVAAVVGRGAPWQDYFAYLTLEDLQRLTDSASAVQEIDVTLGGGGPSPEEAARALTAVLAGAGQPLRAQTYRESGRFFLGIVTAARIQMGILDLVLLIAAGFAVANIQVLSVNERQREIGAMMALGTPRSWVLSVFLIEGTVLAVLFAIPGAAAGAALTSWLARAGIGLDAEAFRWMIGSTRLHPHLDWIAPLRPILGLTLAAAVASLYPASRAARLDPVRALAGYRR